MFSSRDAIDLLDVGVSPLRECRSRVTMFLQNWRRSPEGSSTYNRPRRAGVRDRDSSNTSPRRRAMLTSSVHG